MVRLSVLACVLLGALPTSPALSQQAPGGDVVDFARVTVSASTSRIPDSESALPNTITIIDREQLEQQLAITQDITQVLANLVPSLTPARQKMTNAGEALRGRKPLYMVDGVPQSTPLRAGGRDGHTIDAAMIERIEIIHGANALQGLGASGGIINIITKRAPRQDGEDFHDINAATSTALPHESDGTGWRGSYLFGTRRGALDFVGGASYAHEGLYYDGNGDALAIDAVQGDLMDSKSLNLFAKGGWHIDGDRRAQLSLNRYQIEGDGDYVNVPGDAAAGLPATSIEGRPPMQPPRNEMTQASFDYTDRDLGGGYFQAQLYWADFAGRYGSSLWTQFRGPGTDDLTTQSQNVSEKLGSKFTWSRSDVGGLPLRLTLGLDASRDETYQQLDGENGGSWYWVPETAYTAISPLLQAEYRIGPVLLTGGLRYERGKLEVDDYTSLPRYGGQFVEGGEPSTSETLPNFGMVWEATDALKLYASYSEGYTVADIGRVLRAIDEPGQRVDSLVDLTPAVADNREFGLDYDDGRWLAHLAAYWSDSELGSRLAFDTATGVYNVARERTEIDGIEGTLAFRFSDAGRVGLAYARTRGRYDSDGDDRVDSDLAGVNISPDRLTAFWTQAWTPGFDTRLQASHAEDRDFDSSANGFDGYTTVDLLGRVRLPTGTLHVGIENLFDEQYITYYSQVRPPRDDGYVAGRGRVLTLGWSHRF
ncbi:TonB-dependent receptor [Luteimonas sp. RD2P54]|uniref:TonB-dependent receptor n=1 Tax=Luteimonas endophytica TaxID=3042023 RepID=A0ABT6J5H4_9GAMM|nr:TonB-dependent receptor [Luteimonas endophytica]MDH5821840.1 TonB-dependent receptor [Luteimonas endophytica]